MDPGFGRARTTARPPPGDGDRAVEHLVAAMERVTAARGDLDITELNLIEAARQEGLPWWAIARALGVATAQGACQRAQRLAQRLARDREEPHQRAPAPPSRSRPAADQQDPENTRTVWTRVPAR